jgi:putative mRNA 3-end processing factor
MPVYSWKPQAEIFTDVNNWWRGNVENGVATVIVGYSLGKAQRILQNLDLDIGKVYTHGVIENTNEALRRNGVILNPTERITAESSKEEVRKGHHHRPPSSVGTPWMRKFGRIVLVIAVDGWPIAGPNAAGLPIGVCHV